MANKIAHISDFHQSTSFLDVIAGLDKDTSTLVIHGDWMQCHKDQRPSKGKIKGLPGVDNGYGESVQSWALELPAYINHSVPIEKGTKVDFSTIPSGFLNKNSQNYETMVTFMNRVNVDTKERLEMMFEALYKRNQETGMKTVFFPGHDNAMQFWSEDVLCTKGICDIAKELSAGSNFVDFVDVISVYDNNLLVMPLSVLPETRKNTRAYLGQSDETLDYLDYESNETDIQSAQVLYDVLRATSNYTPVIIAAHEGPKEISDIVHQLNGESSGKAMENRAVFEAMFLPRYAGDVKTKFVYGNDGFPMAYDGTIVRNGQTINVHHTAEMDVKGQPDSTRGGATYTLQE